MRPTLELLGELAEQTRSLVQIELSLVRAELRERGALISSSVTALGVGLVYIYYHGLRSRRNCSERNTSLRRHDLTQGIRSTVGA